jgi:adenylate kinase
MLVGPPGAGKSTVCQRIIQNAARPWTRVCQVCYAFFFLAAEIWFEITGSHGDLICVNDDQMAYLMKPLEILLS